MHFHGVDGIHAVPLAALPWSFGCECDQPVEYFQAIAKTYPDDAEDYVDAATADQAQQAEAFGEFTAADFATCHYHRADWAKIGAIALEILESSAEARAVLGQINGDERLGDEDRQWLASLFTNPIHWNDRGRTLINGRHRLCALRTADVPVCPVKGRYLPDIGYPRRRRRSSTPTAWSSSSGPST